MPDTKQTLTAPPHLIPVVLFADIEGSTALYQSAGNRKAEELIRVALERLTRHASAHEGRLVKTIGDEILCRFPSAQQAALAAMEMQKGSLQALCETGETLGVRIGFAGGELVERDGDVFGHAVNLAARLTAIAKGGQILTSEDEAAQFDRALAASTRWFDRTRIKGLSDEVSIVQIVWEHRNHTEMVAMDLRDAHVATVLELNYWGQERRLTPTDLPLILGRSEDCQMVVLAASASRRHARLEYRRGKFVLVDTSTNGTYVSVSDAQSTRTVYVRDEVFTLVGTGSFALGSKPENDPHVLHYRVAHSD